MRAGELGVPTALLPLLFAAGCHRHNFPDYPANYHEFAYVSDGAANTVTVLDLVYRPGETPWVQQARAAGHRAADGLTMLVEQGAAAWDGWFGRPADRRVMWSALR